LSCVIGIKAKTPDAVIWCIVEGYVSVLVQAETMGAH
jgi:hypothetical protein